VQSNKAVDDRIVVNNLSKTFGKKRAVDGITFGVPEKACFGLLGVNGAGKTTTFKMIIGQDQIGGGVVKIAGFDVATELDEVQRRIVRAAVVRHSRARGHARIAETVVCLPHFSHACLCCNFRAMSHNLMLCSAISREQSS
jgi:ABC-type uncharacterized transport system ATPase subunit